MSKPSSFTSYLIGLPERKQVKVFLKGGETIGGFIVENLTARQDETMTLAGGFLADESPRDLTLIRLCDVSAFTFK